MTHPSQQGRHEDRVVIVWNRLSQALANSIAVRLAGFGLIMLLSGCEGDQPPAAVNLPWEVELTGNNFHWSITDPGKDGKLGTADDLHVAPPLHLPANMRTRVLLRSRDFLYTFELPAQQIREIAVPDLNYSVEFDSGKPRETEFRGDQFCGYAHNALSGKLFVQRWGEYRRWQAAEAAKRPPGQTMDQYGLAP